MSSDHKSSSHHHHHHHVDDATKFKNHTISLAKRRKLISRIAFTTLFIAAAVVVILCILSFFVEY